MSSSTCTFGRCIWSKLWTMQSIISKLALRCKTKRRCTWRSLSDHIGPASRVNNRSWNDYIFWAHSQMSIFAYKACHIQFKYRYWIKKWSYKTNIITGSYFVAHRGELHSQMLNVKCKETCNQYDNIFSRITTWSTLDSPAKIKFPTQPPSNLSRDSVICFYLFWKTSHSNISRWFIMFIKRQILWEFTNTNARRLAKLGEWSFLLKN